MVCAVEVAGVSCVETESSKSLFFLYACALSSLQLGRAILRGSDRYLLLVLTNIPSDNMCSNRRVMMYDVSHQLPTDVGIANVAAP